MASKITIRRVGGLLPAMSLVVLILLVGLISWLSTAGLPAAALNYLEQQAARQGIYLKVSKLRLSPSSGLALRVRNVSLYAAEGDSQPLATLERATFGISASALLRGNIHPTKAEFRGLNISLPTDGGSPLRIEDATVATSIRGGRFVRLTSASARIEGIPVTLRGSFMLPEFGADEKKSSPAPSERAPFDLAALIHSWQNGAGRLQRAIAAQKWSAAELPSIDLRLDFRRNLQLAARISIPRYDKEQFHFRDAFLDIAYQGNTVIINKAHFRTVAPESEVSLQGGYDIHARHLSLHLESTAALTRMAESFSIPGVDMKYVTSWLKRFHHQDDAPPEISLKGDIYFEEKGSPKALSLQGELRQQDFTFGSTEIDNLHLSFFYRDGSFNIDRLQLAFPTGSLTLSASASSDTHKGKARISADLDIPQLLSFASEFTPEPLSLPEGLELEGNLQVEASAELDMPAFVAGATELNNYLPVLHRLELHLGINKAAHYGYCTEQPRLSLSLSHVHDDLKEGELLPRRLEQAQLAFRANAIHLPREEGQESGVSLSKAELKLGLLGISLEGGGDGSPFMPRINSAEGHLKLGALALPGLTAEAVEVTLADARQICPMAADWRQILQQADLRLNTGAMHSGDMLLGVLDSMVNLDAEGRINLTAVLDREGNRMQLDLHPQLTEEGLLVLENVQLELPAAGFAPLLDLAGLSITQIRLPDVLELTGSATYDTRGRYLRRAGGELHIPHFVRTPGDGVAVFKGHELPLSLHARAEASGREGGHVRFEGDLILTHKVEHKGGPRQLALNFKGDSASHVHLHGRSTLDVGTVDQLIDISQVHHFMRDFDTHAHSVTDVDIHAVDIRFDDGLSVTASCDARVSDIGYQMFAFVDELGRDGKPTGRESLRKDFGPSPFRRVATATARVDTLYKQNAEGKMEAARISILNPDLTYDNRPWLRSQGFTGGAARSRLQGGAVIIDIGDSFVELSNIHGSCYPSYALGAYYDMLPVFLEGVILPSPARLETQHCLFPFSRSCPRPMSGCIRMMADEAGLNFLGTTFPLSSFSGFLWFRDGAVSLESLNAACWDGAVNAALTIDYSGRHTGFDGYATLSNINLKPLAAAYGSKQQPALCNGSIRFRAPSPELTALEAYGEVHIVDGELMNMRIFRPVGELISNLSANLAELERHALRQDGSTHQPSWLSRMLTKLFKQTSNTVEQVGRVTDTLPFTNHFLRYDLQEVHSDFTISNGILRTGGMKALGYNLNVGLQLDINLQERTLRGDIWPKISSVPTLILSPITFLSDFMIDIDIYGPLDDIQWEFGLNKLRKNDSWGCSVTSEAPEHQMAPRRP